MKYQLSNITASVRIYFHYLLRALRGQTYRDVTKAATVYYELLEEYQEFRKSAKKPATKKATPKLKG